MDALGKYDTNSSQLIFDIPEVETRATEKLTEKLGKHNTQIKGKKEPWNYAVQNGCH